MLALTDCLYCSKFESIIIEVLSTKIGLAYVMIALLSENNKMVSLAETKLEKQKNEKKEWHSVNSFRTIV